MIGLLPACAVYHAFTVFQQAYLLLRNDEVAGPLRRLDKVATLVAAFGHDLGHSGLNNSFQVAATVFLLYLRMGCVAIPVGA